MQDFCRLANGMARRGAVGGASSMFFSDLLRFCRSSRWLRRGGAGGHGLSRRADP
jgi:hypothetical protein